MTATHGKYGGKYDGRSLRISYKTGRFMEFEYEKPKMYV